MRLPDFDYDLPPELIAQHPVHPRDAARLMVVERATGRIQHRVFADLPEFLRAGDVVVINDTQVLPARLRGRKRTGGAVEVLLLRPSADTPDPGSPPPALSERRRVEGEGRQWQALVRPGRSTRRGTMIAIGPDVGIEIVDVLAGGVRVVQVHTQRPVMEVLRRYGEVPLPPYVHERMERDDDYQTVYATHAGAVAAPTAGLHFTEDLITRIEASGIRIVRITMHIGLGTFRPVTSEDVTAHQMEAEWYKVTAGAADQINRARRAGGRVAVVGTSAVRTLETISGAGGTVGPTSGWSTLFIYSGFQFVVTDLLVTNFHLPKTTLLMLVSAFAGRELIRRAYQEAIRQRYRFYSFGDAMLIL